VKPYRRPLLHPTAGCVALTVRGRRCGRPHMSEVGILFTWDPVKGVGIGGPNVTLCRMHRYMGDVAQAERFEIVGGWIGRAWNPDAKVWTVLVTVYERREGNEVSRHWWALRRPLVFGDCSRVNYDQATTA
jgi:hypothetical protein